MPASKKDLRAQKQKQNIAAGIGDAKGRLPSQNKVGRFKPHFNLGLPNFEEKMPMKLKEIKEHCLFLSVCTKFEHNCDFFTT